MMLLLSSCFIVNYYEQAERLAIVGVIDGVKNAWKTYDFVYKVNNDTVLFHSGNYDENYKNKVDGHLKIYSKSYCNVGVAAKDFPFSCGESLKGRPQVEVFLKNKKNGNSILLSKKTIDMDAYFETVLTTEVFIGSDTSLYIVRNGKNFDWSKAKQLILEDSNDTLYHYTAWYWDKRKECDENISKEKCIVEIP